MRRKTETGTRAFGPEPDYLEGDLKDMTSSDSYIAPEAKARRRIDEMLAAAGWIVQGYKQIALGAAQGVAVREFPMAPPHAEGRGMEEHFVPVYLALRKLRLTAGPQEFNLAPTDRWPRVWAGVYETGYDEGAATLAYSTDGSASLYGSGGGGVIGMQSYPEVVRAGAAYLDALERDLQLLQPLPDVPAPPEPWIFQFIAVTFDGLRTAFIDRKTESPEGHPLAPLNAAGQEFVTQARLSQSS